MPGRVQTTERTLLPQLANTARGLGLSPGRSPSPNYASRVFKTGPSSPGYFSLTPSPPATADFRSPNVPATSTRLSTPAPLRPHTARPGFCARSYPENFFRPSAPEGFETSALAEPPGRRGYRRAGRAPIPPGCVKSLPGPSGQRTSTAKSVPSQRPAPGQKKVKRTVAPAGSPAAGRSATKTPRLVSRVGVS